jgi:hypothetical protein
MSTEKAEDIAVALFGELFMADQLARNRISKVLPKGMELSHFSVLNHLARVGDERTPAQLAKSFHVTRGAMTNTLAKLEWAGHVHIRPARVAGQAGGRLTLRVMSEMPYRPRFLPPPSR